MTQFNHALTVCLLMFNGIFILGRYELFSAFHVQLFTHLLVSALVLLIYFIAKTQEQKYSEDEK